jgi:hypothetical protein
VAGDRAARIPSGQLAASTDVLGRLHHGDRTRGKPDEALGKTAHKDVAGPVMLMRANDQEVDVFVARHRGQHFTGLAPTENRLDAACQRGGGRRSLVQPPLGQCDSAVMILTNLPRPVGRHRHGDMDETQVGVKAASQLHGTAPRLVCTRGKISGDKDSLDHARPSGKQS